MKLVIDGRKIESIEGLHKVIASLFNFPSYYGGNLDALWDCLYDYRSMELEVVWINYSISSLNLGDYANKTCSIFECAANEFDSFKFKREG